MNRTIEFRAWQDNQMLNMPLLGNYGIVRFFGFLYEDAIIMQFTGLTDKNGTKVYEGDILKCLTATEPEDKGFICEFKDYRWKFYNVRYPNDDFYATVSYEYIKQNCIVIGNIHEHAHILNSK
jgi:uncharacterized phage protein (TIGR01671 family)